MHLGAPLAAVAVKQLFKSCRKKIMNPEYDDKLASCPERLQAIVEEFQSVTPRERLELLLEYSMELPDLPDRLVGERDGMEQVHECQSPVFLATELKDNRVWVYIDVPAEAPTVRGYSSILASGFNGATPSEVLATPDDVYMLLGLHEAITPQRLRGLHAIMVYMKRQVAKLT
jgi:cysteine desulfuration protein SufE